MLTEEQKNKNGCNIVKNEQYGYIVDDLSKTLTLEGRTKMCSYYRDLNSDETYSQLAPTYGPNDVIPTSEIAIQPYMAQSNGDFYKVIFSANNASTEFIQIVEKLGINDYEDCVVDFSNPEIKEIVSQILEQIEYSPIKVYDEIDVQFTPLSIVYSTSFSKEVNEEVLKKHFEVVKSLETASISYVEEFISYHKNDLIECFKGRENLVEFITSNCGLETEVATNLIEKINQETISHTPNEVADMAEKVGLTKGDVDGVSNEMVGEKGKVDPSKEDNDNHDDHGDA